MTDQQVSAETPSLNETPHVRESLFRATLFSALGTFVTQLLIFSLIAMVRPDMPEIPFKFMVGFIALLCIPVFVLLFLLQLCFRATGQYLPNLVNSALVGVAACIITMLIMIGGSTIYTWPKIDWSVSTSISWPISVSFILGVPLAVMLRNVPSIGTPMLVMLGLFSLLIGVWGLFL